MHRINFAILFEFKTQTVRMYMLVSKDLNLKFEQEVWPLENSEH